MGGAIGLSVPRTRRALVWGLGVALSALLVAVVPARAGATPLPGSLTQLATPFNCIGEATGVSEGNACGTLVTAGTNNAFQVQLSPDGRNAYSVAVGGALIEYSRDEATGALTVIGCITAGTEKCAEKEVTENVEEITEPTAVALSPDGKDVYVTSKGKDDVVEFEREEASGLLTQIDGNKGCVAEEAGGECEIKNAKGLHEPYGITVSPDGKNVYVTAAQGEAVAEFSRNTSSGTIEPLSGHECIGGPTSGCTLDTAVGMAEPFGVIVSPDGKNVYVAAGAKKAEGAIVEFERGPEGALKQLEGNGGKEGCISEQIAQCEAGAGVEGAEDIAISPDEKNIYVTSAPDQAVIELERTTPAGGLKQIGEPNGCVALNPTGPTKRCSAAELIGDSRGIAISPEGDNVYVGSAGESGVAAFARNAEGDLEQLAEPAACITSEVSGCATNEVHGLKEARRVIVSPDGTNVYVAGQAAGAIAELARAVTPTVTGLNPNQGPYAGETEVTIEGTGFIEGASVKFGPSPARNVRVNSGHSITATAPAGSETSNVTVTTPVGTSAINFGDEYVYGRVGGLDLDAYCESIGDSGKDSEGNGPVVLMKGEVEGPEYAYDNWACVETDGTVVGIAVEGPAPSMNNACALAYPGVADHADAEDPNNAFSWTCYEGAPPPEQPRGGGGEHKGEENGSTGGGGSGGSGGNESTAKIASTGPIIPPAIAVPPPVLAKTGNVAPVSGTVSVKVPGTSKFVPLATLEQVPFGSVIEATQGHVRVTVALPDGKTETGEFFSGEFILRQGANGEVIAELTGGNFSVCPTTRERAHKAGVAVSGAPRALTAAASGSHVVRKLWANAHGKFETKGNYAAGAVQGTEWLTEDLCDGTLIKVTRDKVAVTNLVNHRKVEVKTGHHYLAKAPR